MERDEHMEKRIFAPLLVLLFAGYAELENLKNIKIPTPARRRPRRSSSARAKEFQRISSLISR
jgi:hypothetical protein